MVYAYAFFFGALFIYHRMENPVYGRTYTGGDVIACFFGVIFGMFSLGLIGPNLEALAGAKASAAIANKILERKSEIPQN